MNATWMRPSFRPAVALALAATLAANAICAVYPGASTDNSHGARNGIYMVIRGTNMPALTTQRIAEIRTNEEFSRQYYAANSGGAFDFQYTHILDVPLTLDANNRRIGDWWADAENYVRNNYGLNPESFHLNVFDVNATTPDVNQGWSGVAIIPSNNYANQENYNSDWGRRVNDHELGHRIGLPHAGAYRSFLDDNYTPYVWDAAERRYEVYNQTEHGWQPTTYGMNEDGYGNPFDVMGNISGGHFTVHEKLTNVHWLTNAQVPNLDNLGAGTYRIYAHDQLTTIKQSPTGPWGVDSTYATGKLYGLTYQRSAERFNRDNGNMELYNQTITLEYRGGRDGVQFHLDDFILDMDSEGTGGDRDSRERELEVGRSVEDISFGTSLYTSSGDDDNFLNRNPPAPRNIWELGLDWYKFDVLQTGTDATGGYIDVAVSLINLVDAGDLNDDGQLNTADVQLFYSHWLASSSTLGTAAKFAFGDLDFSGLVDLNDAWLMSEAFADRGAAFTLGVQVPEPTTVMMALGVVLVVGGRRVLSER